MLDTKVEKIQVSSEEASLKDCGCLGRGEVSSAENLTEEEASERWAGCRHAEVGKGTTGHEGSCSRRYRAPKARGVS